MKITEQDIEGFYNNFINTENEIGKVIIGQRDVIRSVLVAMVAGGNVLLEGLPGLGKTMLVKTIGMVMNLKFSRIQFTPDLMPADVTGTDIIVKNIDGGTSFQFQNGPVFSNIVLADEINRATPKTQSALLEAMQEKTVTVGGSTYTLPAPFFVLATQNPIELEGTYPLPEAQMDRFIFKLNVNFPSKAELLEIARNTTGASEYTPVSICDSGDVINMREISRAVQVSSYVNEFVIDLILKAHPENADASDFVKNYVRYGPSPRGAQAIISTSKVYALLDRRYNVSFDDIKRVAADTLRHRIFLNFEALADGISNDDVIKHIILED